MLASFASHELSIQHNYLCYQYTIQQNQHLTAKQHLEQAVKETEELRQTLLIDEFELGFMDDKLPMYRSLVGLIHSAVNKNGGEPDGENDLADLLFWLNVTQSAPYRRSREQQAEASSPYQAELQQLRQEWFWENSKAEPTETPTTLHQNDRSLETNQLHQLEQKIAELQRRQRLFQTRNRITASAENQTPQQFVEQLQSRLSPNHALAQFYIVGCHCYAVLLTKEGASQPIKLGREKQISRLLRGWHTYLHQLYRSQQTPQIGKAHAYLQRLHQMLISPLSAEIEAVEKLYVVLPNQWHSLPLAACYDGECYLAERVVLCNLPAPASLLQSPAQTMSLQADDQVLIFGHSNFGQLPQVLAEAQAIHNKLQAVCSPRLNLNEKATVSAMKDDAAQAKILHLATHAVYREDNPLFSWIQFDDRQLTVSDIYDLDLTHCRLAVLSACDTGRGVDKGGGLIGVGRSLQVAGVREIIMSLWQLEDVESAELMINFYDYLKDNCGPACALQKAQLRAIRTGQHPLYWAGYMVLS